MTACGAMPPFHDAIFYVRLMAVVGLASGFRFSKADREPGKRVI